MALYAIRVCPAMKSPVLLLGARRRHERRPSHNAPEAAAQPLAVFGLPFFLLPARQVRQGMRAARMPLVPRVGKVPWPIGRQCPPPPPPQRREAHALLRHHQQAHERRVRARCLQRHQACIRPLQVETSPASIVSAPRYPPCRVLPQGCAVAEGGEAGEIRRGLPAPPVVVFQEAAARQSVSPCPAGASLCNAAPFAASHIEAASARRKRAQRATAASS